MFSSLAFKMHWVTNMNKMQKTLLDECAKTYGNKFPCFLAHVQANEVLFSMQTILAIIQI
jgi:hypothetical protein